MHCPKVDETTSWSCSESVVKRHGLRRLPQASRLVMMSGCGSKEVKPLMTEYSSHPDHQD